LRRRHQLERILSDLLGQQTELWGPIFPNAGIPNGVNETAKYQDQIRAISLRAISVEVIDWYLSHVTSMEDSLRKRVADHECLDLFYEDIFGSHVPLEARLEIFQRLLRFLGFSSDSSYWDKPTVEGLFKPSMKLNNLSTLQRIPNFAEIQQRFQK